jgi:spore germination protein YaaH
LVAAIALAVGASLALAALPAPASAATVPTPPRRIYSGWGYFSSTTTPALTSLSVNRDLVNEVSPFWYTARWSGSASSVDEAQYAVNKAAVLPLLKASGVPVVPSVTDGMPARTMAAVLANPTLRSIFVSQLVDVAVANGYDGMDLDFESFAFKDGRATWPTTRPAWATFVAQLATALHARGKILVVTTPPLYDAARGTSSGYWVYDWITIGRYVDRLRIMAYDYSVSGGNIAPYPWVESVVAFAVTQVAPGKIQLGVPAYGRSAASSVVGVCPTNRPNNYRDVVAFTAADSLTAVPSTTTSTSTLIRRAAVRTWDPTTREMRFTYSLTYKGVTSAGAATSCTVYRAGWYDAADSTVAKAGLVAKYHLSGLAQWTLGGEDRGQWSRLRSYARTIAPTATAVRASMPSLVSFGSRALITGRAVTSGVPVAGAKAYLYYRQTGTSAWRVIDEGVTTSAGVASFSPVISRHSEFRVVVPGNFDRLTGWAQTSVRARTAITLVAPSATVRAGTAIRVPVTVAPNIKGMTVLRQVYQSGRWVTLGAALADAHGRLTFVFTPTTRGRTYSYRVFAYGTSSVLPMAKGFVVRAV